MKYSVQYLSDNSKCKEEGNGICFKYTYVVYIFVERCGIQQTIYIHMNYVFIKSILVTLLASSHHHRIHSIFVINFLDFPRILIGSVQTTNHLCVALFCALSLFLSFLHIDRSSKSFPKTETLNVHQKNYSIHNVILFRFFFRFSNFLDWSGFFSLRFWLDEWK